MDSQVLISVKLGVSKEEKPTETVWFTLGAIFGCGSTIYLVAVDVFGWCHGLLLVQQKFMIMTTWNNQTKRT